MVHYLKISVSFEASWLSRLNSSTSATLIPSPITSQVLRPNQPYQIHFKIRTCPLRMMTEILSHEIV